MQHKPDSPQADAHPLTLRLNSSYNTVRRFEAKHREFWSAIEDASATAIGTVNVITMDSTETVH